MNRPIKFRAWNGGDIWFDGEMGIYLAMGQATWGFYDNENNLVFGSDDTPGSVLMQFTGLLDKNGKEIYEGDVVKNRYNTTWDVRWDNLKDDQWALFTSETNWPQFRLTQKQIKNQKLEVIGNIYENPELLKV